MSQIQLSGIAKSYNEQFVLHPITLTVEPGEILVVLGPSGCGKSTLLGIVAGLVEPSRGQVLFNGRSLAGVPAERRGIPMVFQDHLLFPGMTIAENIAFGLRARGVPRAERDDRVAAVLAAIQLASFGSRYPSELSGGQKQRVALARAIVLRPPLMLLDEPFSSLDSMLRREMRDLVLAMRREYGFSAIIVTHDPQEALELADRVAVMRAGRVEQVGTPEDIYFRPCNAFVARFLGPANIIASESGDLCVRPEAVQLALTGEGVTAHIVEKRFSGPRVEIVMETKVGHLSAIGPAHAYRGLEIGTHVYASWREQDAVFLRGT